MTWAGLWATVWPGWDAVYPNLVASAISGTVVWLWARRHIRRLHRRHDELHAMLQAVHKHATGHTASGADTNRIVRTLADQLGIDPDTGHNRLPRPRT